MLPCCSEARLLKEGASKEQRRSAAKEAATACSDVRRLAELQQGSTLQLPPYYPVVGGEAENMRYAIYSPKTSPHPKYIHPLCASGRPLIVKGLLTGSQMLTHLSAAKTVVGERTTV